MVSCAGSPCYADPLGTGAIAEGVAPEASGLASSSSDPSLFFTVDDGSKMSYIVAVRLDGSVVGRVEVDGMAAANAEAIVPGVCDAGRPDRCLYIGDIGADPGRGTVTVYRIAEPDASALPASTPSEIWKYTYPDGRYNAEALLIADDGSIVIVTKPDGGATPHRVYSGQPGGGKLTLITTFTLPKPLHPAQSLLVGNVVTDASRLPDRVLLLTYDQAIEYLAPAAGADPATFPSWTYRQLAVPDQLQSEGITYRAAAGLPGCGYAVVSEKSFAAAPEIGAVGCR